jgi:hypothetical protein
MNPLRTIIIGVLLTGSITGCSEDVSVHIACKTTAAPAVECELVQNAGKSEVDVCWDFAVTCANGGEVKAERTCQKIKDGGTAKVVIPADKLTGIDKCGGEGPPTGKVSGITLNGKSFEFTPAAK